MIIENRGGLVKKLWCVICFLFFISPVYAQSDFETTFEFKPEIVENQIEVKVGFRGEKAIILEGLLSYDPTALTLIDARGESGFTVTRGTPTKEKDYSTVKILADANQDETGISYMTLIFLLSNDFILGKETPVFFHSIKALQSDETEFNVKGNEINIRRYSVNKMAYENKKITSFTKIKYWIFEHILLLIISGVLLICLFVSLFSHWLKRQNERITERMEKEEQAETSSIQEYSEIVGNVLKDALNENNESTLEPESQKISQSFLSPSMNEEENQEENRDLTSSIPEGKAFFSTPVVKQEEEPLNELNVMLSSPIQEKNDLSFHDISKQEEETVIVPDENPSIFSEDILKLAEKEYSHIESELNDSEELVEQTSELSSINEEEEMSMPTLKDHDFIFPSSSAMQENQEIAENSLEEVSVEPTFENSDKLGDFSLEETQVLEPINIQESIDPFQMTPDHTESKEETKSTNPNFPFVLILFLISSFFCILPVKAEEYRVTDLRNALVGNVPMEDAFDYNHDGVVDLKDLLATKK